MRAETRKLIATWHTTGTIGSGNALAAALEAAEAERDSALGQLDQRDRDYIEATEEVERLTEALQKIAEADGYRVPATILARDARAALAAGEQS